MVHKFGAALLCGGLLACAFGEDGAKVEYKPLAIGALSEFGMLQSGRYGENKRFKDDWTDHFGAFVTQTAIVNDHLQFDIGLGGLFQFQKRETLKSGGWGSTQYKNFFIGPTVADLRYHSAPEGQGGFGLQVGMFPYKYNSNAHNLGEYLFRTGPYPSYIFNGTYAMVNSTSAYLEGVRASYAAGGFSADVFLTTETAMPALYDFSLAALAKYKTGNGLLEVAAGANAKHLIPVIPSRTSPHIPANAYFEKHNRTWTGLTAYYEERKTFQDSLQARAVRAKDSAASQAAAALSAKYKADIDSVLLWTNLGVDAPAGSKFYTQSGIILMASIGIDLKAPFSTDLFGPEDLKLYAEAALLGVKDYPIFYEKKAERMPVMVGFNFPGFKFLDLIAVQMEYFKSPNMNSFSYVLSQNAAVPTIPDAGETDASMSVFEDLAKRDDMTWSVLLKKELTKGAWVSAQFARDHTRLVSVETWSGMGVEPTEILPTDKDWYWMLQFSFGI